MPLLGVRKNRFQTEIKKNQIKPIQNRNQKIKNQSDLNSLVQVLSPNQTGKNQTEPVIKIIIKY